MKHKLPIVTLQVSNGTLDVFCEASYRRVRPCNGHANFSKDGTLNRGTVVYDPNKGPLYFCGHHCLAWYVKGA